MVKLTMIKTDTDGKNSREITITDSSLNSDMDVEESIELFKALLIAFGYHTDSIDRYLI